VHATSADPSAPAVAAVDGERVTGWEPTASRARLGVDLRRSRTDGARLAWAGTGAVAYRVQVRRGDHGPWRTIARRAAHGPGAQRVTWKPGRYTGVRVLARVTDRGLRLGELAVHRAR
jgi:hypothetical protein